jgi:transketolase
MSIRNATLGTDFDLTASRQRCVDHRRRIIDIARAIPAVHIAPAFSCLEIVDVVYYALMRRNADGSFHDTLILSKGHGAMAQYVVLEDLGVLTAADLDAYCTPAGPLGGHPDLEVPGIEASTGSLGHGLGIAVGMALADRMRRDDRVVYVVLSDGELQEGSVWESLLLAPSLGLHDLVLFLDLNDFQSLGKTSEILPNFYPVDDKLRAFGWEVAEADGHDQEALVEAARSGTGEKPLIVVAHTVKGKGVSYMENVPIWHYRSPNDEEYRQAMAELEGQEP